MKTPVQLAHFSLGSGMVLEGTTECMNQPRSQGSLLPALRSSVGRVGENPENEVVYEPGLSFNSKSVRKKEKCANSKLRI